MFVLALEVDLHLNDARSLKDKRSVVTSMVDGARRRYRVAAAEVAHQDDRQRAVLGFAAVASTAAHATDVIDEVDRFVWSHPEVEVVSMERTWLG